MAATPAPKPEELLAAARQEAAANYDRFARAVADLENFRKRTLREKEELRLFAASVLMEDTESKHQQTLPLTEESQG